MNDIQTSELTLANALTETQYKPLSESVREALAKYFNKIGDAFVCDLYGMVLSEIEKPLLEAVMAYTKGNQSRSAILLGLSRGTLRKKLKIYGFIK